MNGAVVRWRRRCFTAAAPLGFRRRLYSVPTVSLRSFRSNRASAPSPPQSRNGLSASFKGHNRCNGSSSGSVLSSTTRPFSSTADGLPQPPTEPRKMLRVGLVGGAFVGLATAAYFFVDWPEVLQYENEKPSKLALEKKLEKKKNLDEGDHLPVEVASLNPVPIVEEDSTTVSSTEEKSMHNVDESKGSLSTSEGEQKEGKASEELLSKLEKADEQIGDITSSPSVTETPESTQMDLGSSLGTDSIETGGSSEGIGSPKETEEVATGESIRAETQDLKMEGGAFSNGGATQYEEKQIGVSDGSASGEAMSETAVALPMPTASEEDNSEQSKRLSLSESYLIVTRHIDGTHTEERPEKEVPEGSSVESSILSEAPLPSDEKQDSRSEKLTNPLETEVSAFDLLELIHAAEKRQAEADGQRFEKLVKKLKEKYEEELKDSRAKELMYIEEVDRLEKEVTKEKVKATAALKQQQEKLDERLQRELTQMEEAAESKAKKLQILAEAQTLASVAQEKLNHLLDMKDTKIQIDALSMAFNARSEAARQSHSVHKLSVGTFALEDAINRGAPVEKAVNLLLQSISSKESDSIVNIALSSLPKEAVMEGTSTREQLLRMFEDLRGPIRELSLISPEGGGVFTHLLAKGVSALKLKENGRYTDGIEAVISQVDCLLGDGKLVEAAEALKNGVEGTKAEKVVAKWVREAQNRAVMEQALQLLQAHTTVIASSLA